MKNGVRYTSLRPNELAMLLDRAGKEGRDKAFKEMRERTYKIKERSVAQAPVDTGELEAAHRVRIHRNQTNKAHYRIEVTGVINGVDVDDYAYIIEEGIGWYHLGQKSKEKQDANPSVLVGAGFLRRAVEGEEAALIKAVYDAAYKGAKQYVG